MTASSMLQEARALIEAGWLQGWYCHVREDGGVDYCILGALNEVYQQTGCSGHTVDAVIQALESELPEPIETLDDFNDDGRTTKRRVLALFDQALVKVTK